MDIKTLSDSDLYALMTDIQNELRHRTEVQAATSLIGVLQANQYTAAFAPLAKAISFGSKEYDNGFFYDSAQAELTLGSGTRVQVDLSDISEVEELLTDLSDSERREYGSLFETSSVRVDLRTGEVVHR